MREYKIAMMALSSIHFSPCLLPWRVNYLSSYLLHQPFIQVSEISQLFILHPSLPQEPFSFFCELWCVLIEVYRVLYLAGLGSSWNYKDHGPETWAELGYSICEGMRQSPIDISNAVKTDPKYRDCSLEFKGYDAKATGTWQNNGHSFQFTLDTNTNKGSVAACDKIFELVQVKEDF